MLRIYSRTHLISPCRVATHNARQQDVLRRTVTVVVVAEEENTRQVPIIV